MTDKKDSKDMLLVKMATGMSGPNYNYTVGQSVPLSAEAAIAWVGDGIASFENPTPELVKKVTEYRLKRKKALQERIDKETTPKIKPSKKESDKE